MLPILLWFGLCGALLCAWLWRSVWRWRRAHQSRRTIRAALQAHGPASWPLQMHSLADLCSPSYWRRRASPAWLLRDETGWRLYALRQDGSLYQGGCAPQALHWLPAQAGAQALRRDDWIAFDDGRELFYLSAPDSTWRLWCALQELPVPRAARHAASKPPASAHTAQNWLLSGALLFLFALTCSALNPYQMRGQIDFRWLDQAGNLAALLLLWRAWRSLAGAGLHWRSRILPCAISAFGLALALRNGVALLDVAISPPGAAQAWRLQAGALSTPAAPGLSWRLSPQQRSAQLPKQAVFGLTTLHGRLGTLQTDYHDEIKQKLQTLQTQRL